MTVRTMTLVHDLREDCLVGVFETPEHALEALEALEAQDPMGGWQLVIQTWGACLIGHRDRWICQEVEVHLDPSKRPVPVSPTTPEALGDFLESLEGEIE